MSTKRAKAMELATRTVANLKGAIARYDHAPFGPGSEALQARMADLAARDVEALEIWEEILRCVAGRAPAICTKDICYCGHCGTGIASRR